MGEAKRRRQNDPTFARVPKRASYRGLVVSPPVEIEGSRLTAKLSNLHPQELRFALLFWDKLVWPSSRAIHFASSHDELFLERAGILSRPDYTINGDAARGIALGQVQAFQDLERAEPGVWALAQGEDSFLWRDGFMAEGTGAVIELHRAVPIPRHDVPLAEILEFKVRRRDELLRLRSHLEAFVSDIEGAEDKAAALQQRIAEIDKSCADLLTLGRQWQFPVTLSNIKASFSLTPQKFLVAAGGALALGQPYGLPAAAAAAAVAGVISTLEIKGDFGMRSVKRPASPYRYAYRIVQELR